MKKNISNIGFIGAGNMATAIISGLIRNKFNNSHVFVSSPEEDHLEKLKGNFSVNVSKDNREVVNSVSTLVLAVKPNVVEAVLDELSTEIPKNDPLLISIVAGYKIASIEDKLESKLKIVRAMPNTPASIGMGVSALTANQWIVEEDKSVPESVFGSIGLTCWLEESAFDLFTALIGSGPAYIFYFIEALQEAAKGLNLDESTTKELITEMIKGSSTLANQSEDSLSLLREKVTSPGGVTEKALEVLNRKEVGRSIIEAILEAADKSKTLGGS